MLRFVAILVFVIVGAPMAIARCELADLQVTATLQPTSENLKRTLTIHVLDKHGKPVTDAKVKVNLDMPSMPMAHHMAPLALQATDKPGVYASTVKFNMLGEWAARIDISGPIKQSVVRKLQVD